MTIRHGIMSATAAFLLATGVARADVVAGGPVNAANSLPFDAITAPFTEFQVLYPAADFSGSTNITGLEFFDTYFGGGH